MQTVITRYRLTADDYHRLATAGILGEDDRVELIEGELIEMAPIGSRHASKVKRLIALLSEALHGRAIVAAQDPVALGNFSEPQPDIAVLRPRDDYYEQAHPGPDDVLLLIEVADTSACYDREVKMPLYARHGIPEVWLLDLEKAWVEVYVEPSEDRYLHVSGGQRGADYPARRPA
jgi:Uma2 family endonuclease